MTELVDLELWVHRETTLAWQVSEEGDPEEALWLPKSQCEIGDELERGPIATLHEFTMPEWLAIEKGLV